MTVTKDDFEKIWASSSPLTPYSFSDSQYKEGWNFVGSTPPSRQMWDAFMQNADEKLKYLYQHEDIPLGHEYFTFNPNVPQGSLPLFGGEYDRATYSDLWNWVQEQTGYLKTEAEWQTLSASNNGNVPYYSDGDGSTTFRVPSLKCWVKGANGTVSEVGSYLEAGLPNITGVIYSRLQGDAWLGYDMGGATNAFYGGETSSNTVYGITGGIGRNTRPYQANFDASRSNSIYGNSTTVQPPSIVGMWLVKAYGVIVDTGTIDEQQYIDDRLATKLNITGGNLIGNLTINGKNVVTEQAIDISSQASFSVTSSNATVQSKTVYKTGSIIWCTVGVKTTASISVGDSVNLSFSGIPAPVIGTTNSSYISSTGMVIATFPASTVTIRVISGTAVGSDNTLMFSFSYPTA